ncbi:hypothetical protein LZ30DRAFT_741348 [Colletotrichum cereale]|nr:hypothetical protein LZ30DRAFT_741348 [Colletotrichum cereale]
MCVRGRRSELYLWFDLFSRVVNRPVSRASPGISVSRKVEARSRPQNPRFIPCFWSFQTSLVLFLF